MFQVTESAREKLMGIIKKEKVNDQEKLFLRISIGYAWGGSKLNLSLEEQKLPEDHLYTFADLDVLIHNQDLVYFDNTKLDYQADPQGNGRFLIIKI